MGYHVGSQPHWACFGVSEWNQNQDSQPKHVMQRYCSGTVHALMLLLLWLCYCYCTPVQGGAMHAWSRLSWKQQCCHRA